MTAAEQVCTRQQAKRLKELGVVQKSLFWYTGSGFLMVGIHPVMDDYGQPRDMPEPIINPECSSAFTVAELGVMLPSLGFSFVKSNKGNGKDFFWLSSSYWKVKGWKIESESEAQARAETLIRLLNAGIVTADEVNQRLNQTTP